MKRTCFQVEVAGLPITLTQQGKDNFTVQYWEQVKFGLNYSAAALELGACIMHASALNGTLDQRMKGEK